MVGTLLGGVSGEVVISAGSSGSLVGREFGNSGLCVVVAGIGATGTWDVVVSGIG